MIKKIFSLIILNFISCIDATLYIYHQNSPYVEHVTRALEHNSIPFEFTSSINYNDDNLYIIFDVFALNEQHLPHSYITYQSRDLNHVKLSSQDIQKLSRAVAVWDYSFTNIKKYSTKVNHYYYFPPNYEFADLIVLSCLLPIHALDSYKAILSYSNQVDTDISSHLPALFCYALLQKPSVMVEAGVRSGESTKAFAHALVFNNSTLIGLDIDRASQQVYAPLKNATFWCMNDLEFPETYAASTYQNLPIDFIFVDTSHMYEHTLRELSKFVPLLTPNGMIAFHDSNINNTYVRLNSSSGSARGNPRGVTYAIKDYFHLAFDEYHYNNFTFKKDGITWIIIHYPFCNGLTLLKKEGL